MADSVLARKIKIDRGMTFLLGFGLVLFLTLFSAFRFNPFALKGTAPYQSPETPVKLIFIHHSCGENLLDDGNGGLGLRLAQNHYFVSDTNYGWGPDSIGDRTDILDWPEWFIGSNSTRYLDAVFHESGQNSNYTRLFADPGGENQIILFKSCFPNSNLAGSPNDTAAYADELSVASAKQVYIDLLAAFQQHPDKLFVVLTAPPMISLDHPKNTRAFNTWLVEDWLDEAQYPYDNVAVWDFYNVLSGKDNHHMLVNGGVVYITNRGGDTHAYPDGGDDHPSRAGNQKAVDEFVPMLNMFYTRWKAIAPAGAAGAPQPDDNPSDEQDTIVENPTGEESGMLPGDLLDDFENNQRTWECFADEAADTQISCAIDPRNQDPSNHALHMQFSVASQSWATTVTFFPQPISIAHTAGIHMQVLSSTANPINVVLYRGSDENRETYLYMLDTKAFQEWHDLFIPWEAFKRAEWESGAQEPFSAAPISGFGFGMDGMDTEVNIGQVWVDEIFWSVDSSTSTSENPAVSANKSDTQNTNNHESNNEENQNPGISICPGAGVLIIVVLGISLILQQIRLL